MTTEETATPIKEEQVQGSPPKDTEEADKTITGKRPVTKEKLRSIMEAASALTALGDEDEENGSEEGEAKEGDDAGSKRYIPEHKKPDAALTFPEKLMSMMKLADKHNPKEYCIAWLPDGKSFVIRNPDEFTKLVLPDFFKATKFSSFTRKLYRWGFRQVNRGIGPDDPIIFGNEYFQRDNAELMVKMRSITAAGTRKCQTMEAAQHEIEAHRHKRPLDMGNMMDEQRKRMFLEQMLSQQQKFGMPSPQQEQPNFMQPQGFGQSLNLATALRPGMGGMPMNQQVFKHMNQPSFNQDHLNLYMAQQQLHQQQQQQQQQHQQPQQMHVPVVPEPQQQPQMGMPQQQQQQQQGGQSYNQASTAEIVNAAINALRYAS